MEDFELSKLDKIAGVAVELCSDCMYDSNMALLGLDEEDGSYIIEPDLDQLVLTDSFTIE
jgi:hypothetical protein|tara:strand:+ start:112 stop:291 length:180 start_codon:yes stop_codon:yes gene_type:complete